MVTLDAWIWWFLYVFKVADKKGNELASISVYLNTPIVAVLLGVGFIVGSVLFAGVMLIASWLKSAKKVIFLFLSNFFVDTLGLPWLEKKGQNTPHTICSDIEGA